MITPRHKLIVDVQATGRLLFDLQQDPGETISLYGRDDALRADMETRYQRWLDRPRSGTVAAVPGPGG